MKRFLSLHLSNYTTFFLKENLISKGNNNAQPQQINE